MITHGGLTTVLERMQTCSSALTGGGIGVVEGRAPLHCGGACGEHKCRQASGFPGPTSRHVSLQSSA